MTPETRSHVIEATKRICRERCAQRGEPYCFDNGETVSNQYCESDNRYDGGCHFLACIALNEKWTKLT
jgi:hypothetical protein